LEQQTDHTEFDGFVGWWLSVRAGDGVAAVMIDRRPIVATWIAPEPDAGSFEVVGLTFAEIEGDWDVRGSAAVYVPTMLLRSIAPDDDGRVRLTVGAVEVTLSPPGEVIEAPPNAAP